MKRRSTAGALALAAGLAMSGAALGAPGDVIITEIFANPNDSFGDRPEFVEIYNTTDQPIDISGWMVRDEDATPSAPFPQGTILGAHQALVIIGMAQGTPPDDPPPPPPDDPRDRTKE